MKSVDGSWWARLVRVWLRVGAVLMLLALPLGAYLAWRFTRDTPVVYEDPVEHFKYGSTGGERLAGIPLAIWNVLPELFADLLPGEGWASLGFIYEPGRELPVGVSQRNVQGIERVFLNCAVCHAATVRATPDSDPVVYAGTGANRIDLGAFQSFLQQAALDARLNGDRLVAEIDARGDELDFINRLAVKLAVVPLMRQRLIAITSELDFVEREPAFGPGRFDTFNPAKALLGFPMDALPEREWIGTADFPSIWMQGQRAELGLNLHWDGNNDSTEERNKSAAFGTGTTPPTIDLESIDRMQDWLAEVEPPPYPFPIDAALAERGAPLYARYCADCHGRSGRDFTGEYVGDVVPIEEIATDRHRLDSYTLELNAAQNTLYAGYDWRFKRFRKTFGYANMPLDGIWLRSPYLHNGSVPTLLDLLEPGTGRPATFRRGYDVFDQERVGYRYDVEREGPHEFFLFDTALPGNGNFGHEGREYGTELPAADKRALVEFLKTF